MDLVSGKMIADALAYLGADISYYSRTRKPEAEQQGMQYKPLARLLAESEVVFTCLNKNVLLLGREEFARLGAGPNNNPKVYGNAIIAGGDGDRCIGSTWPGVSMRLNS